MKKYKIIVLSDLSDTTHTTLKSAIGLAKMINGEIALFTVKKPTDIIEKDNQLSAMRTINSEHTLTDKKIQSLIAPLAKDYGVAIKHSFVFGNIKNEIGNYIKESRPDIIVMGKRKSKPFNLIGDGISQFVLNTFNGVIMVANDKNPLESNKEISLGVLNGSSPSSNFAFAENLIERTQKPLKSFKILTTAAAANEMSPLENKKTIEYVFEHSDSTVRNLSNYLSKSNVDLLFIERGKKRSADNRLNYTMPDMKDVIGKLDVTLLVAGR